MEIKEFITQISIQ